MRRARQAGQLLERASRLDRIAQRPDRDAVGRGHRIVDGAPLVQHRDHRELLDPQPPLFGHQLVSAGPEPLRGVAAQLIQPSRVIEHVFDSRRSSYKVQEDRNDFLANTSGSWRQRFQALPVDGAGARGRQRLDAHVGRAGVVVRLHPPRNRVGVPHATTASTNAVSAARSAPP